MLSVRAERATAECEGDGGFSNAAPPIRADILARLKGQAFTANRQAKNSDAGAEREVQYRKKDAAINYLLEVGCAFVNSVDWSKSDPVFGIEFAGGGRLHTKLSCLSIPALHRVRQQIN